MVGQVHDTGGDSSDLDVTQGRRRVPGETFGMLESAEPEFGFSLQLHTQP